MTVPDHELLLRSGGGDMEAFEQLVRRHQASAFRLLRSLTRDVADAEDALQETFLAVWRSAGDFRGTGSARAWILTIARNAVRRQHRRRVDEPADLLPLDELGLQAGWGRDIGRDDLASRLEDRAALEAALRTLATDDREVLLLRDVEGFSGAEVATALGISVPAMKSRLHRARLRLSAALTEDEDA